jgi:indolepyruvate ferredoxin oxidoreductase alpha subunit
VAVELLLGNEAVARGAIDAGVSGVYGYPGTPSTEALEYAHRFFDGVQTGQILGRQDVTAVFTANEKTSLEAATGMSYAGGRAFVTMKHVGLNVAADPFMSLGLTGAHGGLVLLVCDDPYMHSSQNEQDSRFYAMAAGVPVFEPATPQEAYDMTRVAYTLSEELHTVVMVRVPTRLAHSKSAVQLVDDPRQQNQLNPLGHDNQFMLLPGRARKLNEAVVGQRMPALEALAESFPYNHLTLGNVARRGIIAIGLGRTYVEENIPPEERDQYSVLSLGMSHPLPAGLITTLGANVDELLVVEEGQPLAEKEIAGILRGVPVAINGKLNHTRGKSVLPRTGELTPDNVRSALGKEPLPTANIEISDLLVDRPPRLCTGCPHDATYRALNDARLLLEGQPTGGSPAALRESRIFSDIGCYTLGFLPPFYAIDTCIEMGGSIPMAIGAKDMGLKHAVAVIGDSTYTASGRTGILDAAMRNVPITIVILDNKSTAMTGSQPSPFSDPRVLEEIIALIGREHVHVIDPHQNKHESNVALLQREMAHQGTSVIVAQRKCLQAEKGDITYRVAPGLTIPDHPLYAGRRNVIIAGVGGQGILSSAGIVDLAALESGLHLTQLELHGMSQRGGCVDTHVRFSDGPIYSGLVPIGGADLVIGVEPLEALRNARYLRPDGIIVTSSKPVENIRYDLDAVLRRLGSFGQAHVFDAERIAQDAGSAKASNTVVLGAASHYLGLPLDLIERQIPIVFASKGEKVIAANIAAFRAGREALQVN